MRDEGAVALIPARGGSRSIPRKNLRDFAGFPLLAWSIEAARQARGISRVLVSTDDPEILQTALAFGAEAPFLRPPELARDETPDLPVFEHALRWLEEEEGYRPRLMVQLRPTSPLRPLGLVDEALGLMEEDPEAHSLRAVSPPGQNPYKMWRPDQGGCRIVPLLDGIPEAYNQPRQSLPPTLWQTGHLDVVRRETLISLRSMTGSRVRPIVVGPEYSVDIDTTDQWAFAEWVVREGGLPLVRPRSVP